VNVLTGLPWRRVLPIAVVVLLTSPLLVVWESMLLVAMVLLAVVWPRWREVSRPWRWGVFLGVGPYLLLGFVLVVFFGFGDNPTGGEMSPTTLLPPASTG